MVRLFGSILLVSTLLAGRLLPKALPPPKTSARASFLVTVRFSPSRGPGVTRKPDATR